MQAKIYSWISFGFRTFILREKLPYLFGMVITDRCNLNCFYCESKNLGKLHFPYNQAKQTILEAFQRGHRSLYITGGEPMLWEDKGHDLGDIVTYARDIGFNDIYIFTNGTKPLLIEGCGYIITIEGPKEVHDKIRNNTYDMIISNVKNAVTKNIFATITFTKANAQYLKCYIDEINNSRLFRGISFNFLTHKPEIIEKHGISFSERKELLDKIWKYKKAKYPIVLSKAAYKALKNNDWKRPIVQIELGTPEKIYTCCRSIDDKSICNTCGYTYCVEVSQILSFKLSAIWQVVRMVNTLSQ